MAECSQVMNMQRYFFLTAVIAIGLVTPGFCQNSAVDFSETYEELRETAVTISIRFALGAQQQSLGQETAQLVDSLKQFNNSLTQNTFQPIQLIEFWQNYYERVNAVHTSLMEFIARQSGEATYRVMGAAVREDGLVLSNSASVLSSTSVRSIEVWDANQMVYSATVCALDLMTNLALLKVNGAHFDKVLSVTPATEAPAPGSPVFSIQHCYTPRQTTPVVGTMGNTGYNGYGYQMNNSRAIHEEYFQMVMPVYPESEGAPIFDQNGNLLGLLAFEYRGANYPGTAFGVPSWMIADVVTDLIRYGRRYRGALGVTIENNTRRISEIYPDGAADRAGLEVGDVIESFNGVQINNGIHLQFLLFRTRPNQVVHMQVRRNNQVHLIETEMDLRAPLSNR